MKGGSSSGWGEFPAVLIQQPAPRPHGQPLMGCIRLWRLVCSLPVLGHTCLCVPALKGPPGPGAILVKVKPDGLQQWLLAIVIQGFESRVLGLVGTKTLQAPDSVLAEAYHYQEEALLPSPHQLHELWPLVPMVWQDPHVVYTTRAMIGNSNSAEAAPGTIREDSRETSASTSEDSKRG